MSFKLNPQGLKSAEYARQLHHIVTDVGVFLEDILQPEYWAHVAKQLHVNDRIEVVAVDGAWYAELLVQSCSNIHAKCAVLAHKEFHKPAVKTDAKAPYYFAYRGESAKHSVMRTSDKAVVKEGFDSKAAAEDWLAKNQSEL
jgi:hypothetical protein